MTRQLLITGGTGYLGLEVIRQAAIQGWRVVATHYSQSPPPESAATWHLLDVRTAADVERLCTAIQPDVVVHTAFRQTEPDLWEVSALGSHNVATAARAVGSRLIHMSTDVIFDGDQDGFYTEDDTPTPITAYGTAKADAEHFVQAAHPASVLIRTSLIYGFEPMDRHTQFILDVADGRNPARLFRDEIRCPIFVGDLAAAILLLAEQNYSGIINVAGMECISRYTFGCMIAEFYGRDPERIASALSSEQATRRPRNCALDIQRAQALLSIPLRGVRTVLAEQQRKI